MVNILLFIFHMTPPEHKDNTAIDNTVTVFGRGMIIKLN